MSKYQGRRVTRRTAKRLLRGAPVGVPDALACLLAAAAAPPRDGEWDGERAATAAFAEAAHRANIPPLRSPSMIRTTMLKLLTVKVAAAAAAIFTVGGVTAVAATGHLGVLTGHFTPSSPTSAHPAAGVPSLPHVTTTRSGASSSDHRATPSPSLVGLCHAYTAGAGSDHGKALESPAFTALITAAGGRTKVDVYCTVLLAQQPSVSASASAHATSPVTQTTAPGKSADTHGNTTHPTGAPTTHPTGAPVSHPNS